MNSRGNDYYGELPERIDNEGDGLRDVFDVGEVGEAALQSAMPCASFPVPFLPASMAKPAWRSAARHPEKPPAIPLH